MAKPVPNMIGQKFGRLTVVERATDGINHRARWLCKCSCGNDKVVTPALLINGHTKSCGCLNAQNLAKRRRRRIRAFSVLNNTGSAWPGEEW